MMNFIKNDILVVTAISRGTKVTTVGAILKLLYPLKLLSLFNFRFLPQLIPDRVRHLRIPNRWYIGSYLYKQRVFLQLRSKYEYIFPGLPDGAGILSGLGCVCPLIGGSVDSVESSRPVKEVGHPNKPFFVLTDLGSDIIEKLNVFRIYFHYFTVVDR